MNLSKLMIAGLLLSLSSATFAQETKSAVPAKTEVAQVKNEVEKSKEEKKADKKKKKADKKAALKVGKSHK